MNHLHLFYSIDLLLFAICLLIFIAISLIKKNRSHDISTKLLLNIVFILIIMNFLEGLTWFLDGTHYVFSYWLLLVSNTILICFNSFPAVAWVAYADYKIFDDYRALKKRIRFYLIPFYITLLIMSINFFTGFVFTINSENQYARNIGLYLIVSLTYLMITILYLCTFKFKKQINGRILESVFLFMLIPILAGVLQSVAYGLLIIWPAFSFSTLIAYVQIEQDNNLRDALTGLPTRERFVQRVQYLNDKAQAFSIILGDINNFKQINDCYGHHTGDEALITTSHILESMISSGDTVYRFGGDEFLILIESDDHLNLNALLQNISNALIMYNESASKPYQLSISFGCSTQTVSENRPLSDLLKDADQHMYQKKEAYKKDFFEHLSSQEKAVSPAIAQKQ
ncbi:GGDEF domain-containing protein [Eubacteriaceae bacterium ES2]|nr:GGDEF domain-containing protein [Eubacteriaceae bacterium ES2]